MPEVLNVNDVLEGHVVLELDCLDRIYLNGYAPKLQVGGQVITFLTQHLGNPVASPALFKQIGDRFSNAVRRAWYRAAGTRSRRSGGSHDAVTWIGVT